MFRTTRMKLYRRFLILAVLLTGLYALPVSNNVAANACCDACDLAYDNCVFYCENLVKEPCVATCESDYLACGNLCPGPPMGCSHP